MLGSTSDPFGTFLRRFRQRGHHTQQQLATTIGVHRTTIGRWEESSMLPERKALVLEVARQLHLDELETRQLLEACPPGSGGVLLSQKRSMTDHDGG